MTVQLILGPQILTNTLNGKHRSVKMTLLNNTNREN